MTNFDIRCILTLFKIDGDKTKSENFADLVGFQLAYEVRRT